MARKDKIGYLQHIMDFDEGNVHEENVHDIANAIMETGLHRSAGRYGRFLDWYHNEYKEYNGDR